MKAMAVRTPGPVEHGPLEWTDLPVPVVEPGSALVRVEVCGVCRTDVHVVEGELPPRRSVVVPGHEVVGRIAQLGPGTGRVRVGDRVGVAWLHATCGVCRYCRRGSENLCAAPRFTGYDVDGGYAEYVSAPVDFLYPLPEGLSAREVAPLLCAGIIGYRALRQSHVPKGGTLGLYGFGASAHIVIQIARFWGCEVFVATRGSRHQALARSLGAAWVGGSHDTPPARLDAAILFAPAGELVPVALGALDKGGTLAVAGIYLTEVPPLIYRRSLFDERTLTSVTANTRQDGLDLLSLAREIPIRTHTEVFPLRQANEALRRLKTDEIRGAAVLEVEPTASALPRGNAPL